jgi:hypothetical protein
MALLDTHLLHFDEAECPFQRTGAGVVVVSFFQQLDLQPRHVYGEQGDVGCVLKGGGVHVPTPHLNSKTTETTLDLLFQHQQAQIKRQGSIQQLTGSRAWSSCGRYWKGSSTTNMYNNDFNAPDKVQEKQRTIVVVMSVTQTRKKMNNMARIHSTPHVVQACLCIRRYFESHHE